eukprot:6186176-Pleurochrysis_carterae.AAC.1
MPAVCPVLAIAEEWPQEAQEGEAGQSAADCDDQSANAQISAGPSSLPPPLLLSPLCASLLSHSH